MAVVTNCNPERSVCVHTASRNIQKGLMAMCKTLGAVIAFHLYEACQLTGCFELFYSSLAHNHCFMHSLAPYVTKNKTKLRLCMILFDFITLIKKQKKGNTDESEYGCCSHQNVSNFHIREPYVCVKRLHCHVNQDY